MPSTAHRLQEHKDSALQPLMQRLGAEEFMAVLTTVLDRHMSHQGGERNLPTRVVSSLHWIMCSGHIDLVQCSEEQKQNKKLDFCFSFKKSYIHTTRISVQAVPARRKHDRVCGQSRFLGTNRTGLRTTQQVEFSGQKIV